MNGRENLRLPKEQILHRSKDFDKLLRGGKKFRSDAFDLVYAPNNLSYPRIGYIVGKKISAKAVVRNRIKRIIREYFRNNKEKFGSNDVIFICKIDISSWKPEKIGEGIRGSADFN